VSDSEDDAKPTMETQIQSVMNIVEETGESLIQNGADADAVVRGTLLAAMFLGSPLADYGRLSQWLRETADRLDEPPAG
jgi:hypothetical protein